MTLPLNRGTEPSSVEVRAELDDRYGSRISGTAVWSGFAVGLAMWILLELLIFAVDLAGVDVGVGDADTDSWFWNGIAAVIAFFVGAFVAGCATPSRSLMTGALEGLTVWGMGLIAALVLVGLVGGAGFGALGDVFDFEQSLQQAPEGARISESAADEFREASGWATAFVALTLAAGVAGGILGGQSWPRTRRSAQQLEER